MAKKKQELGYVVEVRIAVDPMDANDMKEFGVRVADLAAEFGEENVRVKSTRMRRVEGAG